MDRRWLLVACCALAGCKQLFGLDEPIVGDAGGDSGDSKLVDAGTCISVSAMCLGDTLRTCSAPGETAVDIHCTWGCGTSANNPAPHCKQLVPAGDGAVSNDLDPAGLTVPVTLGADIIIDGDTGRIGTTSNPNLIRGTGLGIVNGIDYELHNGVAVFRMSVLTVTGPVSLIGAHPIAVVSIGDVAVNGVIDARGPCTNRVAGPGGFAGGALDTDGTGTGAGKAKASTISGGGGAGYGGKGGDSGPLTGSGAGGAVYGDAAISKLVGGSGGAGASNGGANAGVGGGGGGAMQLLSNSVIQISSTGGINAGGCGGKAGTGGSDPGGGGGSGGTIVLEAPRLTINGVLAVNGGAGGGGGGGSGYGESGTLDRMRARTSTGTYAGGVGGAGASLDGGDAGAAGDGGGGGGVGRIRFTTLADSGLTVAISAVLSPSLTDSMSTCTRAASVTQ